MLSRQLLQNIYDINSPASPAAIAKAQSKIPIPLPSDYKHFLSLCNGLHSHGNLAIHEIEDMPERNADYEVEECLPGFFMIGDDSGGQAILINRQGEIFEVGMGSMSKEDIKKIANSIEDLLITHEGKTLNER